MVRCFLFCFHKVLCGGDTGGAGLDDFQDVLDKWTAGEELQEEGNMLDSMAQEVPSSPALPLPLRTLSRLVYYTHGIPLLMRRDCMYDYHG